MSQDQQVGLQEEMENVITKGAMDYMLDCYAALSIPNHANQQEITEAYKRLCYVSDLEEREKTLLLHEGEGKLSRVQSRLIYRDFLGVRLCTG